jgi:hypothetical protein
VRQDHADSNDWLALCLSSRQSSGPLIEPGRNLALQLVGTDQPHQRAGRDLDHNRQQLRIAIADKGEDAVKIIPQIGRDDRGRAGAELIFNIGMHLTFHLSGVPAPMGSRPPKGNAPSVFVAQAGDTIEIVLVQPADN